MLFDSKDDIIPLIRADLDFYPVKSDGKELIYIHDALGYASEEFMLDRNVLGLIALMDENRSVSDMHAELARHRNDVQPDDILRFIRHLDSNRILHSPYFRHYVKKTEEEFESARIRPAVCNGTSYPDNEVSLREMLDPVFEAESPDHRENPKALFAPHIDPRVGLRSYAQAFSPLRSVQPRKVIMLATSHYAGSYYPFYENTPFIASRKTFKTPLGESPSDQKILDLIEGNSQKLGCSFHDRAHRVEHSIEIQLLFLHYLWDHPFEVVPLLVGSFEPMFYTNMGELNRQVENMAEFLGNLAEDQTEDVFFLISGDLAHVGKKFGDQEAAESMFSRVKLFDGEFLEHASNNQPDRLLNLIKKDYDPYRICGFPPLYTFLMGSNGLKGQVTSYQIWDETEQQSAVSFGSILYE